MASWKPPTSPMTLLGRHPHVVEQQLAGVDAAHAHLAVGGADAEPGRVAVDDERGDRVVVAGGRFLRLGEHRVPVGLHDARHPALGAAEDVLVAVLDGLGAHAHDVGAGLGFGQAERAALVAGGDAGQVLLLLLLGAGDHDRAGWQPGEQQHERGVFEYLATSSMAMVRPRMPAPPPPYASGMHRPSRSAAGRRRRCPAGIRRSRRSRGPAA